MLDVRLDITRLEKSVKEYEKKGVEPGKIVFYGDSGFTRWQEKWQNKSLEEVIHGKDGSKVIINHGIGGSTSEELLYYYPRLVRAWEPKALVFMSYCNDRDVSYSPMEIIYLQSRLFEYARKDFPGIKLYICDVRPIQKHIGDLAWMAWGSHLREYNELLGEYCAKHCDCILVSHAKSPLFFADADSVGNYDKPRTDIFIEDQVHYNPSGYEMYAKFFREVLDDVL